MEKAREFQKNIYFCFIDYAKSFDCVGRNKLWKILQEMGIPYHLTCLLSNSYAGQQAIVSTRHGTTDWFQIGKGVRQGCILYSAYLTYMQSKSEVAQSCPTLCDPVDGSPPGTSCEMPGWISHKLESRLLGGISITSDMKMAPPLWQKVKRN